MSTKAARLLEIKGRITDKAHELADLLGALADADKDAIAFADARALRQLAARYVPQASILDEPGY